MGGEHEVCILHAEMAKEISSLSKDIGKVSERVGRVEENTKCLPEILQAVQGLTDQKNRTLGFVAGVSFIVSLAASGVAWLATKMLHL